MNILGIAGLLIDGSAALIRDGRVVAAVEEERSSRIKHKSIIQSGGLPYESIETCFKYGNISFKDVDYVGYFFEPWREFFSLSALRLKRSFMSPSTVAYYQIYYLDTLRRHLAVEKLLRDKCKKTMKFHWLSHHLCHAAAAYYASPFDRAAILVMDALGEIDCTSFYIAENNRIKRILKYDFPHSLGFMYATLTDYLGFKSNNDEYKVMGLASFGEPVYYEKMKRVFQVKDNGRLELDFSYFDKYFRGKTYVNDKFISLFGPVRSKEEKITERHMDIAASMQKLLEESALKMLKHIKDLTACENICLGGGVALNCKMNGLILKEGVFRKVFLHSASHDAGCALGAAYLVKHEVLNEKDREPLLHAYLGDGYTDEEIKKALQVSKVKYESYEDITAKTAELLAKGNLVAWFQGRAEWGPRALGARSILADPTRPEMKDIINERVKHREEFRPFAPSVACDDAHKYFHIDDKSPFMLFVVPAKKEARDKIPAVVHVDGTSRVHTVDKDANPLYYDLLRKFECLKGVPVLLNTSFNVNKEPIVNNPYDALRCFFSTGLDYLVMGHFLIGK